MKKHELMDLENQNSLVRRAFQDELILKDIDMPHLEIPEGFEISSIKPRSNLDLAELTLPLGGELERKGFSKKLANWVHEALRNAYEHGNQQNSNKKVTLAKLISPRRAEFFVGDEGGTINASFVPYVLMFRQSDKRGEFYIDLPNFYNFSGLETQRGHSGVGTRVMHLLFDEVKYFKSRRSGLLVYLAKEK